MTPDGVASPWSRAWSLVRAAVAIACAVLLFGFAWLLRFNDPGGVVRRPHRRSLLLPGARLADPVRRSAGARLRRSRRAALLLRRRGGAAAVRPRHAVGDRLLASRCWRPARSACFWLAHARRRARWCSALAGAACFRSCSTPRFYNYPKILVYVAGHPAAVALRRSARASGGCAAGALVTAVGVPVPPRSRRVRRLAHSASCCCC